VTILPDEEQDEYFIAFMYEELLRGDLLSVVQALAIQRQQAEILVDLLPAEAIARVAIEQQPVGLGGGCISRSPIA
jgi:hypothetical protein